MDATRLWPLEGVVQRYAWGSRTAIPEFLGVAPDGEPQAELWLGAHPNAPARVRPDAGDAASLDACIARDPDAVLGADVARRFDGQLPFLVKVLAAEAPLSIQAHPNSEQAIEGFAREGRRGLPRTAETRCYRDPHPKPELICAIAPFRALSRFRSAADIEARITALRVPELETVLVPLREAPDRDGLAAFFQRWMTLGDAKRAGILGRVVAAASVRSASDPACAEVEHLAGVYPGDPGVLAPLFLNLVELQPGEAMYLPAGELHSYLRGVAVEVMANSDNVIRGGLTPKHVDVDELLSILSFASGDVDVMHAVPNGSHEARYATPNPEFAMSVVQPGAAGWRSPGSRGAEVVLCIEGRLRATDASGRNIAMDTGSSLFAPAAAKGYTLHGGGTAFRVHAPPPGG